MPARSQWYASMAPTTDVKLKRGINSVGIVTTTCGSPSDWVGPSGQIMSRKQALPAWLTEGRTHLVCTAWMGKRHMTSETHKASSSRHWVIALDIPIGRAQGGHQRHSWLTTSMIHPSTTLPSCSRLARGALSTIVFFSVRLSSEVCML